MSTSITEDTAKQLLSEEEGRRNQPYYDSSKYAYVTAGIGRLLDPRKRCPLPDEVVDLLFQYDFRDHARMAAMIPGFFAMNNVQQAVIISMVFQMGYDGVMGFNEMVKALKAQDWSKAAHEGLDSKWAREDSPRRARRQMEMLKTGLWVPH